MNKKYIKILVALISLNILFQATSFAQNPIVVKDASGNPIPGVKITIGEGAQPILTNDKGEFTYKVEAKTPVLFEAEGFEPQIVIAYPAVDLAGVTLTKSSIQMTYKDEVDVPFNSFKKRQVPGSVIALNTDDIMKYDHAKNILELINGRVPGFFGSMDNRGLGTPLTIVDGVPRTGTLDYNLEQIDQVTVSKDLLTSMLYGGQANNGIIYITTKRGIPLKKTLRFSMESGINKAISYPKFLSSGDYMSLYNEALANDGLAAKYSQADIDATISGIDPVRYPNQDYYNSTYLKKFSSYNNFVGETQGGNDIAQYYLNIGWNRTSGMLKPGEGGDEKTDRINVRGNVDYKLNEVIKIRFDAAVIFNIINQPRYTTPGTDFWTLSSTLYPNSAQALIPVSLLNDPTLLGAAKVIDGKYILGGTSEYMTNIYGELTKNGPTQINNRNLEMNVGLDFDLKSITEGLKASVFFSYDLQNNFRTDIPNLYAVYKPTYAVDNTIASWSKYNVDAKVNTMNLADLTFSRRNGLYGKIDYHKVKGDNEITINGLGYYDQYSIQSNLQPLKHVNLGVRANYNYKQKYTLELVAVENGSIKLAESNKWGFSPGIGLGWIVSEESFLKENSMVNYLKLRANMALTNNDENLPVYYSGMDNYVLGSTFYYNHGYGTTGAFNSSYLLNLGNPNLGFEKRLNYNVGFESFLMDQKLGFEASYFYYKTYNQITKRTNYLPTYFGSYAYENYGSNQNQGIELGLNYTQKAGDVSIRVGGNFVYSVPKNLIVDELNYPENYRKATGKPTDALFGFVAEGLFKDQADIDNSTPQTFGVVKPGDIKYKDLNGDNVIDDLDQKMIGNSHSRVEYSFNLSVKYKAFELFALATGQHGMSTYFNSPYYWVYGTRKYSEAVLNRWTPATAETATYPRLTTSPNDNDFRNSTYWLYKNNWFTLQTLQLTYTVPGKIAGIKEAHFFLRGNNLMTISKIKDKSQLNIGTAPQTRFYSLGISIML